MRLIDADALIKVIQQNDYMLTAKHNSMAPGMFTSGICQAVDESQTIDPVKHGRWVGTHGATCNLCGYIDVAAYIGRKPNYCPSCGARMDGEA